MPNITKTSGYLQKRRKLRLITTWKKYWFVLEGRLLLYYRSKTEYDAISPCKGSISLGPPCTVRSCPSIPCAFQLNIRANTIILRAENGKDLEKWMYIIMLAVNQIFHYPEVSFSPFSDHNKNNILFDVKTPINKFKNLFTDKLLSIAKRENHEQRKRQNFITKILCRKRTNFNLESSIIVDLDNNSLEDLNRLLDHLQYVVTAPVPFAGTINNSLPHSHIKTNPKSRCKSEPNLKYIILPVEELDSLQSMAPDSLEVTVTLDRNNLNYLQSADYFKDSLEIECVTAF